MNTKSGATAEMRMHSRHVDQAGVIGLYGILYEVPGQYIGKYISVDSVSLQLFPHYPTDFLDPVPLQIMLPGNRVSSPDPHTMADTGHAAGTHMLDCMHNKTAKCGCLHSQQKCRPWPVGYKAPVPPNI